MARTTSLPAAAITATAATVAPKAAPIPAAHRRHPINPLEARTAALLASTTTRPRHQANTANPNTSKADLRKLATEGQLHRATTKLGTVAAAVTTHMRRRLSREVMAQDRDMASKPGMEVQDMHSNHSRPTAAPLVTMHRTVGRRTMTSTSTTNMAAQHSIHHLRRATDSSRAMVARGHRSPDGEQMFPVEALG